MTSPESRDREKEARESILSTLLSKCLSPGGLKGDIPCCPKTFFVPPLTELKSSQPEIVFMTGVTTHHQSPLSKIMG